jgi:hypothetical protein
VTTDEPMITQIANSVATIQGRSLRQNNINLIEVNEASENIYLVIWRQNELK